MGVFERLFVPSRCDGGKSVVETSRLVLPGHPNVDYCDNRVKSSKYTFLTFLPLNFLEQFTRPINFYFLVLTAIQFIPVVAPVSPLTALVPLVVTFLFTAAKAGVDDWKRHRLDREFNTCRYSVVDINKLEVKQVESANICVGDLLLLRANEVAPCDVVLLASFRGSEVRLSTESLDGETTSKERIALLGELYEQLSSDSDTGEDCLGDIEDDVTSAIDLVVRANCRINSEHPNAHLNSYTGTMSVAAMPGIGDLHGDEQSVVVGIGIENVALTSSVITSTKFVLGVAVLTGNETKVAMTQNAPPTKWSLMDQVYNRLVIVIFAFQLVLVVVCTSLTGMHFRHGGNHWYLGKMDYSLKASYYCFIFVRFFLLVSTMVPFSFKVIVDASKAYISEVITWDAELRDETGGAGVHNSSLAEDLGQIEYIMTDKTGTLTRNNMRLHSIVLPNGLQCTPDSSDSDSFSSPRSPLLRSDRSLQLLRVMLYCNTVESAQATPSRDAAAPRVTATSSWASSSPDEVALVDGCASFGARLLSRRRHRLTASFGGRAEAVTVLKVLKFTPERRRMSVLLRIDGARGCLLLTKGADESVLPRCAAAADGAAEGPSALVAALDRLSRAGLRTLVAAYRELDDAAAEAWLSAARRQKEVSAAAERVYDSVERDLILCGITAVEDELQDKVPSTIAQLRRAGMRMWMLTGDKNQTARQTAVVCGLLKPEDSLTALSPCDAGDLSAEQHKAYLTTQLQSIVEKPQFVEAEQQFAKRSQWPVRFGLKHFADEFLHRKKTARVLSSSFMESEMGTEPDDTYAITLSGQTVELIKECKSDEIYHKFTRVLIHASTVICSRMTPDEKSFIVQMVRDAGRVALAIGDGGNDVAMIQCAHVGIGIKGKEGNRASVAADFSLSQFCFLTRLLLFHGHTAYQRSAFIVHQSFWKAASIAWIQVLFNMFTDFSAVSFWDSFSLTMYNSLITVPVTFLCVLNMPLSASMLMENPELYALCQRGRHFSVVTFYGYVLRGLLHGTALFFMSYTILMTGGGVLRHGYVIDRTCDFYVAYFAIVTLHSGIVLLESHSITLLQWIALAWSVVGMFLLFTVFAAASPNHSFITLLGNFSFYLHWIIVTAVPLFSLSIYAAVKQFLFPDLLQLQRLLLCMAASSSSYRGKLDSFFQ